MAGETTAHVEYLLRLADTNLIWAHRLSEWTGHGPVLEEDIALANIGLDAIGQARMLYQHAGALEGKGRDEDALAYWRDQGQYRNFTLAELPKGDYAFTIIRNLALAIYFLHLWEALQASSDPQLAAIAQKAVKESRYHVRHARDWTVRFGASTPEARRRVEAALLTVWRYLGEMFADDAVDTAAVAANVSIPAAQILPIWTQTMADILADATLAMPPRSAFESAGKRGIHGEHLSLLLAEMQSVARAFPGAKW